MKAIILLLSFMFVSSVTATTTNPDFCEYEIEQCEKTVQARDNDFYQNNKYMVRVRCKYRSRQNPPSPCSNNTILYDIMFNACFERVIQRAGGVEKAKDHLSYYENECNKLIAKDLNRKNKNLRY